MVKQQENNKELRKNRKKKSQKEKGDNVATRGRPKKEAKGSNDCFVQKQFTQEFIEFGKQYLEWKLNENYVWANDFDKKSAEKYGQLGLGNQQHQQVINAFIANMNNMMEREIGRQFRQLCIDSYLAFKNSKPKQKVSKQLLQKVFTNQNYTFLSLRNQAIPYERKDVEKQVLVSFIESTIKFVQKIATMKK